jgi:hypothetical protein
VVSGDGGWVEIFSFSLQIAFASNKPNKYRNQNERQTQSRFSNFIIMCLTAVLFRELVSCGHALFNAKTESCSITDINQQWLVATTPSGTNIQSRGVSSATVPYCLSLSQSVSPRALEVYGGPLENNAIAVVLFNLGLSTSNITDPWADLTALVQ